VIAFFDASSLIYVLEGREPWVSVVKQALAELVATDPAMGTAVSRLSWLECRVGPLRRRD